MPNAFNKIIETTETGIPVLYEDNHLLVVVKPACVPVQADESGDPALLDLCKEYIKKKYNKPGNVFLGLVHRLDRPVSGVIVFARTSKAASRLSNQFRKHDTKKSYLALCEGSLKKQATLIDYLERKERHSFVSTKAKGKQAELSYHLLKSEKNINMIEIDLKTGRHHQIRVQFSSRGNSLLGDFRYGSKVKFPNKSIALHSHQLTIFHPTSKKELTFTAEPPLNWPIH